MPEYIVQELENARKEAEKYRLQAESFKVKMDDYKSGFNDLVKGYTTTLRENLELKKKIEKFEQMALKEPFSIRDYIICECLLQFILNNEQIKEVANAEK